MAALQTEEWKRFRENTYKSFEQPVRDRVTNLESVLKPAEHALAMKNYFDILLSTGDYTKAENAAFDSVGAKLFPDQTIPTKETLQDISKVIKGYEEPKLQGFSNAKFKGMFALLNPSSFGSSYPLIILD